MMSHGATCKNWNWSWSFINEEKRQIYIGAWEGDEVGSHSLIFSENWRINGKGRKNNAYGQTSEHLSLVEHEEYSLFIFKMKARFTEEGQIKISSFENKLIQKGLNRRNGNWYAIDLDEVNLPEEILDDESIYFEGTKETITVNSYERNSEARSKCIEIYGCHCYVCKFDFEKFYGLQGAQYIHVHHKVPLYEIQSEYQVCPENDLIPVCANCHAMLHRGRKTISIDELIQHINDAI